ncbi:MAG: hypothetical protein KDC70_09970 [Saprospiraceae bacterium]|nr:hypothetical protein [Saprospiraceae bacterium]
MKLSLIMLLGAVALAAGKVWPETSAENTAATEQTENPRLKHFRLNKDHVAIDGYDPVSYFKGGPKKGKSEFSYEYEGVIYRFSNADNMRLFKDSPGHYEPAWGGWCGHAMAVRGEKVEINPECYKIINGRNVLFFKTFYANALSNWEKEIKKTPENTLMEQGDRFWTKTLAQ